MTLTTCWGKWQRKLLVSRTPQTNHCRYWWMWMSCCRCYRDSLDKEKNLCSKMFGDMRGTWTRKNQPDLSHTASAAAHVNTLKWHLFKYCFQKVAVHLFLSICFAGHLTAEFLNTFAEWQKSQNGKEFWVFIDSVSCSAKLIITWFIHSWSDNCANKNLKGIGQLVLFIFVLNWDDKTLSEIETRTLEKVGRYR